MKILLNSIGQTLQKHGPGHALCKVAKGTRERRQSICECGCNVASSWQRPPQQTTKNCIAIFTRNLFCGNIVKVFERRTGCQAARLPRWRHLAKLHTNMCVCADVSGCCVCVGQMANVNWPQMLYIFICLRYALISDCFTFYLMPQNGGVPCKHGSMETETSAKLNLRKPHPLPPEQK